MIMTDNNTTSFNDLTGKFLIASPYGFKNDVFNKSLIYVVSHNEKGSMGLIINHMVNKLPANSVLKLFKDDSQVSELVMPIYFGGPVEQERGFILHTCEYDKNLLLNVTDNIAVSSNIEILKDIATGSGPRNSLFVLGYTGWEENQLEKEIQDNMWIISDSCPELMFSDKNDDKWSAALDKMGIDNSTFTPYAGHC